MSTATLPLIAKRSRKNTDLHLSTDYFSRLFVETLAGPGRIELPQGGRDAVVLAEPDRVHRQEPELQFSFMCCRHF